MELSKDSKIYVAGHNGMVGSACWRLLKLKGYTNLVGYTSSQLDLKNEKIVSNFFKSEKTYGGNFSCSKSWGYISK